jgi:O-succinylbenzoic acid--CoA ligase
MNCGHSEDWLAARARATPSATAVIIGDKQWNYSQLNDLVHQVVHNLYGHTKTGERVAALLPNSLAFVCLIHALARIGAILVPLNTRLSGAEISWQLKRANCTALVFDKATADQVDTINTEGLKLLRSSSLFAGDAVQRDETTPPWDVDAIQAIIFTSGTTGKPKGAMLTFSNHFYSAVASGYRLGVWPKDIWLCCLPIYHVGGLAILLRSCLYGTAVELHDGFHVAAVSDSLDTRKITLVSLVPTMLHRLLCHRGARPWPPSLRHVLLGGAAVSAELVSACQDRGIPVSVTYGLTEAASQVATMVLEDVLRKPGCAGKSLLLTRVAIVSEDGRELPAADAGEIIVSGPTVMAGYVQDEESSARVLQNEWLHTGDIGYLDEDGDLWVLQRRDDIIVTGGENVYPAEVEALLKSHPAVSEACVVGIQDKEWGQRVAAAVVLREPEKSPIVELLSFCRQHLAGYKLPRQLVVLQTLPQTASGKIHRQAVAEIINGSGPTLSQ